MAAPHLNYIDEEGARLADTIEADHRFDKCWHLGAKAMSGKSAILQRTAQQLRQKGRLPILVDPPHMALDAGQVALTQVVGALGNAGELNGEIEETFFAPRTWREQRSNVAGWLEKRAEDVVILCDEPGAWRTRGDEEGHFREKTESVIQLLLDDVRCQRVVAGRMEVERRVDSFDLNLDRSYEGWLTEPSYWSALGDTARELWSECGAELNQLAPLNIRLIVGLSKLVGVSSVANRLKSRRYPTGWSEKLAKRLAEEDEGLEVLKNWAKCDLVREPIERAMWEEVFENEISEPFESILKHSVLYEDDLQFHLHDDLRLQIRDASHVLSDFERKRTRETLADYYAGEVEDSSDEDDVRRVLRAEMEGFHHAVESDDSNVLGRFRAFFVEQLNVLGKRLSKDHENYDAARDVFERAVRRDPQNDYAHHYLAYNFDIVGEEPDRVEQHYKRALELEDENAWWWSRWICFLIVRSRISDAKNAWSKAREALALPDADAPNSIYENLHKWVARLLLHRSKLTFAENVLRDVPEAKKDELRGFYSLDALLERLRDARSRRSVFPAFIDRDGRWETPHLVPEEVSGKPRRRWLAGRVESIDETEGTVHLVVGESVDGDIEFSSLDVPAETFDDWSQDLNAERLEAGRFVELGEFGDKDPTHVIRVHPKREVKDKDLPPLSPDPTRYLER